MITVNTEVFLFKTTALNIIQIGAEQGVVGWELVGTAFPHLCLEISRNSGMGNSKMCGH